MSQLMSPSSDRSALWELSRVSLRGNHRHPRLNDVTLSIPRGCIALMGVSGAGKSSLLQVLAGFEKPDSGQYRFQIPHENSLPVFWAPQDYGLWPHLTALEHIQYVQPKSSVILATEWLQRFRLGPLADARPATLSEGEQSRLSVARALAAVPAAVLLDEPLAHVDPVHRDTDWQTVFDCSAESAAVVFSCHEPAVVRRFADHVICLDEGRVSFSGNPTELLFQPPDETTAWLLGPCNWLDDQLKLWFPHETIDQSCLRPEQITLVPDETSTIQVSSVSTIGTETRVSLKNTSTEVNTTLFVTHSPDVRTGNQVSIRLSLD